MERMHGPRLPLPPKVSRYKLPSAQSYTNAALTVIAACLLVLTVLAWLVVNGSYHVAVKDWHARSCGLYESEPCWIKPSN